MLNCIVYNLLCVGLDVNYLLLQTDRHPDDPDSRLGKGGVGRSVGIRSLGRKKEEKSEIQNRHRASRKNANFLTFIFRIRSQLGFGGNWKYFLYKRTGGTLLACICTKTEEAKCKARLHNAIYAICNYAMQLCNMLGMCKLRF